MLVLVAGRLFFKDLGAYPLYDPDEARHAEVAREMAGAQGVRHLFLPTLDFRPYREKPAPFYWLVAVAYRVVGVGEAGARAVSALAALLTLVALYAYALPRTGADGALAAGLVAATSAGWFGLARYTNLDMTLTACVTVGVLAGLAWLERPAPRPRPLLPYVAAAAGVLVKGPIGALLVFGPLAVALLVRQPRPGLRELGLGRGVLIVCVVTAAFWVPLTLLDATYLTQFTATNLRRFGARSRHIAPPYYYALWLPLLAMPWTLLAVPALTRAARDAARRPLVLWLAFVPTVLTLARGKLATYALSALVPFALLVGPELARVTRLEPASAERRAYRVGGALAVALLIGVAVAPFVVVARGYPLPWSGRLLLSAAALGWAIPLGAVLQQDRLRFVPLAILGATLTLYPLAIRYVAPAIAATHSTQAMARLAAPNPVIAFGIRDPSLTFYLGGPVLHTDDVALARDLFSRDEAIFLLTSPRHFAEVESSLGPLAHRWSETRRRRLYGNRPPPANGSS